VIFLAGCGVLLLFASQRGSPEYLWLGVYLTLVGSSNAVLAGATYALIPGVTNELFADPATYLFLIAQIEFTHAFVRRKLSRTWRAYEILLLCCPVATIFCATGILGNDPYFLMESAVAMPVALSLPLLLLYWRRRGNEEARWIIFPSLCPAFGVAVGNSSQVADFFGWKFRLLKLLAHPLRLWGETPLLYSDIADVVFLLAIGVVMFFRFTLLGREQARVAAELGAAREVQQQLVPATLPEVAGCRLESVYVPASEVGGDFFQILPQACGSSLIVVGDVSGKGLKAAMTGALAIGALRTLAAEGLSPGALLTRLNGQIVASQNGGFITCLCASLAWDGAIVFANAGHLAPYVDGEEVELEPGLPLGLAAGIEYSESMLHLNAGDRIVLMTDGVVEAQAASGELFGFDRTRAISREAVEEIAHAAQAFGQQDDITVVALTIEREKVL